MLFICICYIFLSIGYVDFFFISFPTTNVEHKISETMAKNWTQSKRKRCTKFARVTCVNSWRNYFLWYGTWITWTKTHDSHVPELRTRNSYRWRRDYVVGARSNRGSLCAPVKQSLRKEGEVVLGGWIAQSMVFVVSELNRRTLSIDKKWIKTKSQFYQSLANIR